MNYNPDLPILLVEDNPDDVLITKRAWKKGLMKNELVVVNNGERALKFLKKEGEYANVRTPCLVLLDLKMPIVDGFEVLEEVKKDETLKKTPIIVLTSSERKDDINRAYMLGCNSYIVKPVSFEKFIQSILDLKNFWLSVSKIPDG